MNNAHKNCILVVFHSYDVRLGFPNNIQLFRLGMDWLNPSSAHNKCQIYITHYLELFGICIYYVLYIYIYIYICVCVCVQLWY